MYRVQVTYADNWQDLSPEVKQQIANDVAINTGQYFAHIGLTWLEILTWHDYRITGVYPHFPSAFSWEDTYSNPLGIYLAGIALRDIDRDFNEAMTYAVSGNWRVLSLSRHWFRSRCQCLCVGTGTAEKSGSWWI